MDDGRNLLAEIVAMLFSLASIAQFAATASPRRRRYLLDIMREAEASGVRVAIGEGLLDAGFYPFASTEGYAPEDAMHLAVCLRALAMALYFPARLLDRPRQTHHRARERTTLATWLIVARTPPRGGADRNGISPAHRAAIRAPPHVTALKT